MLLMSWIFERQLALGWSALEGYSDITTMEDFHKSRLAGKNLPPCEFRTDQQARCPAAKMLDVACPCEDPASYVAQLIPKLGIFLVIVLAKTFADWTGSNSTLVLQLGNPHVFSEYG